MLTLARVLMGIHISNGDEGIHGTLCIYSISLKQETDVTKLPRTVSFLYRIRYSHIKRIQKKLLCSHCVTHNYDLLNPDLPAIR